MTQKKGGLGKGLDSLLGTIKDKDNYNPAETEISNIEINLIQKAPWQARKNFDDASLIELAQSIKNNGVIQPIVVKKLPGSQYYQLIAGERRLRAAQYIGLTSIPARIIDVSDSQAAEIALIENLQREDLNPLEEAEGYRYLSETLNLTQEEIATHIGKSRAYVANSLRLLSLPEEIKRYLITGELTEGHGKVLAGIENKSLAIHLAQEAVTHGWSVRRLEEELKQLSSPLKQTKRKIITASSSYNPQITHITDLLRKHLGTNVKVTMASTDHDGKVRPGKIEIHFYSNEDLTRILEIIGVRLAY